MRHLILLLLLVSFASLLGNCGTETPQNTDAAHTQDGQQHDTATNDTVKAADVASPLDSAPDTAPLDQSKPDLAPQDQATSETQSPDEPTQLRDDSSAETTQPTEKLPDAASPEQSAGELTPEAPPADRAPPSSGVPAFIAQGDIGRTTISCDDGKTWKANRSWELEGDAAVCGKKEKTECYNLPCEFTNKNQCEKKTPCDCDHHPGAPQGMAFGNGWFVGTWGWGPPGSVRRSQDGVKWETVITGTTFGGIDFGNGTFVTGDRAPRVSTDSGKTWQNGGKADLQDADGTVYNVRSFAFVNVGQPPGRFIVTGESGTKRDILVSADQGKTWVRPTQFDRACASSVRGIAGGNGVIVILSGNKTLCRSTDAGKTFALANLPDAPSTRPIWDGKAFHFWLRSKRYSSPDGKSWTATPLKLAGSTQALDLGAIARSERTGTYVAVRGGWTNWYSKQAFYRSTDGINWSALATSAFVGSHRIRHIRFGYATRSAQGCQ